MIGSRLINAPSAEGVARHLVGGAYPLCWAFLTKTTTRRTGRGSIAASSLLTSLWLF